MKPIHIFRRGKHPDRKGEVHDFSEARLQACAAAYDPALHEAPICVGHPQDNRPAYGWIQSLDYREGDLYAAPHQVDDKFAELVDAGRFKKISASFYPAGHKSNPVGDQADYLRHVAFLGAQPPAVKGLRNAEFHDDTEGVIVVEFADVEESIQLGVIADTFRRIREWLIGSQGQETADQVVPAFQVETLQRAAERELHEPPETTTESSFEEDDTVTKKDTGKGGGGQGAGADDRQQEFAEREADLKKREEELAERERRTRRAELVEFVDDLVEKGRVLPRDKDNLVEFLDAQDAETELEFAEHGDDGKKTKTVKKTGLDWFREFLEHLPPAIDYSERAGRGKDPVEATPEFSAPPGTTVDQHRVRVHARAKKLQGENKELSFTEAAIQADRELKQAEA